MITVLRAAALSTLVLAGVWAQPRAAAETAQQAPAASTVTPQLTKPAGGNLPDHKIVPNDLLSIQLFDEPGLSQPAVRVGADGTVVMPVLKNPVRVLGMLPREVKTEIERQEIEQGILIHPVATVAILEYAYQVINVVGFVKSPGPYSIANPISLFDALSQAGWTLPDAAPELLFSKSPSEPARKISIEQLLHNADPSINVMLTGGEVISVPEAPKVWVTGNITHPQAVVVRRPGDATVLKIVASVEGLTQYYAKVAYIYRPDSITGKRQEIPVPLWGIMHRKNEDVTLQAEDILLIPDDNGTKRRAILQELMTLSGVGASTAIISGMR